MATPVITRRLLTIPSTGSFAESSLVTVGPDGIAAGAAVAHPRPRRRIFMMAAFDSAALLARYRPVVQYDSLESYYTDWAAVISDRPGNVLKRADGTVLAAAGPPSGGVPQLNLNFLHPQTYPTGQPVAATDYIAEVGSDYVTQAREMHAMAGYANKAHGRVIEQAGATWLQYWFFMYYDDPSFLGLGTHEGDIEMIQLRLDPSGQPEAVSYAQHRSGVSASWDQVEQRNSSPVVYSARGTHASMLRAGDLVSDRSFLPDHNDAQGPRVQLDLIPLSEAQTPWAFWPGRWGATRPEDQILGQVGVEANSPTAPNQHGAWTDPAGFHASCEAADLPPIGEAHRTDLPQPPQPLLQVQRDATRGVVNVKYEIPTGPVGATPTSLVIAVDSSNGRLPPATTVVGLAGAAGELEAPVSPDAKSVRISATVQTDTGAVSPTTAASAGERQHPAPPACASPPREVGAGHQRGCRRVRRGVDEA
jgi:hypothetical protein